MGLRLMRSPPIYRSLGIASKPCDVKLTKLVEIRVSSKATKKLGVNFLISKDKAGYAINIPSGILVPVFIVSIEREATKFPPALSPTRATRFGLMLK